MTNEDPNVNTGRQVVMTWDVETTKALEDAYQEALSDDLATFTFQGREFVTPYAAYLIMYLASEFQRRGIWS